MADLPFHLVLDILSQADLPMDSRIHFGVKPKKIQLVEHSGINDMLKTRIRKKIGVKKESCHIGRTVIEGYGLYKKQIYDEIRFNVSLVVTETDRVYCTYKWYYNDSRVVAFEFHPYNDDGTPRYQARLVPTKMLPLL
jgi:hypothetical protein